MSTSFVLNLKRLTITGHPMIPTDALHIIMVKAKGTPSVTGHGKLFIASHLAQGQKLKPRKSFLKKWMSKKMTQLVIEGKI